MMGNGRRTSKPIARNVGHASGNQDMYGPTRINLSGEVRATFWRTENPQLNIDAMYLLAQDEAPQVVQCPPIMALITRRKISEISCRWSLWAQGWRWGTIGLSPSCNSSRGILNMKVHTEGRAGNTCHCCRYTMSWFVIIQS